MHPNKRFQQMVYKVYMYTPWCTDFSKKLLNPILYIHNIFAARCMYINKLTIFLTP